MSHNNCILTLLDLKDKNITFSENWMEDVQINGIRSKVISGILSFQPTHCYNCGHLFDSQIIKHGFKTSRIKMMKLSGFDTYLDLKKQRYKCRHCDRTFTLKTSLVESNCYLSNPLKQAIFLEASHKKSESDIARDSTYPIQRSIGSFIHRTRNNPFILTLFQRCFVLMSLSRSNQRKGLCHSFFVMLLMGS